MTEIGTIMIFEADNQPGGTHIIEDHFIEEVLDPETGEPGAVRREGRTRRHVVRTRVHPADPLPHQGPRLQGPAHDCDLRPHVGPLRGRHPRPRRRHEADPRHQRLPPRRRGHRPRVSRGRGVPDRADPRGQHPRRDHRPGRARNPTSPTPTGPTCTSPKLGKDLADNHEGLRFNVDRAAEGELPRFELKAKRLQDKRDL